MKNWKKWLALLLSVAMLLSLLAACGGTDEDEDDEDEEETEEKDDKDDDKDETKPDETKPQEEQKPDATKPEQEQPSVQDTTAPTQPEVIAPQPNVPSGEMLDKIPGACTYEELTEGCDVLYIKATSEGEEAVFAYDASADDVVIAYVVSPYDGEVVIEATENDYVGYYRAEGETSFTTQPVGEEDFEEFMAGLQVFTMFSGEIDGMTYKATDNTAMEGVTIYEAYSEGELQGFVGIDDDTGLLVMVAETDGNVTLQVTELDTIDARIPQYK